MTNRISCAALALALAALSATAGRTAERAEDGPAARADGFVPIAPEERESVSGKTLLVTSYVVILGGLLAYAFSIVRRDRALLGRSEDLRRNLDPPPSAAKRPS